MNSTDPPGATLHTNVALLECDSGTTLEETLLLLADLPVHITRVSHTALAFPAAEFAQVRAALEARQRFPTIVGEVPKHTEETTGEGTE